MICFRKRPDLAAKQMYGHRVRISDFDDENEKWIFTRIRIETIRTTDYLGDPKDIRIFCVDQGDYLNRSGSQLENIYELPEESLAWPLLAVTVYLADLKPTKNEPVFRPEQNSEARDIAVSKTYYGKVCRKLLPIVTLLLFSLGRCM